MKNDACFMQNCCGWKEKGRVSVEAEGLDGWLQFTVQTGYQVTRCIWFKVQVAVTKSTLISYGSCKDATFTLQLICTVTFQDVCVSRKLALHSHGKREHVIGNM